MSQKSSINANAVKAKTGIFDNLEADILEAEAATITNLTTSFVPTILEGALVSVRSPANGIGLSIVNGFTTNLSEDPVWVTSSIMTAGSYNRVSGVINVSQITINDPTAFEITSDIDDPVNFQVHVVEFQSPTDRLPIPATVGVGSGGSELRHRVIQWESSPQGGLVQAQVSFTFEFYTS